MDIRYTSIFSWDLDAKDFDRDPSDGRRCVRACVRVCGGVFLGIVNLAVEARCIGEMIKTRCLIKHPG